MARHEQREHIAVDWQAVGPGGGGGHMDGGISPADPDIMIFACDMGGIYLTLDGAKSWRMLPGEVVRKLTCPAGFHPTDPDVMYVITKWGLYGSRDRGGSWEHLIGGAHDSPVTRFNGTAITFDPHDPDVMLVAFSQFAGEKGHFVLKSVDGGRKWSRLEYWPGDVSSASVHFNPTSAPEERVIYAMGRDGVKRSADWGRTWETLNSGLPAAGGEDAATVEISSFGAAWAPAGESAFYVTVPSKNVDGRYVGGVYKSTDLGMSWSAANEGLYRKLREGRRSGLMQYRSVTMGRSNTELVYVISSGVLNEPGHDRAVWRSTDGGASWQCVTFGPHWWKRCNFDVDWMNEDLSGRWWWSGGPGQICCCPTEPERVFTTNGGNGFMTTDAGGHWSPVYTDRVGDTKFYRGRGCEVLTCYTVYVDPHDSRRRWIAYTDIGCFMSADGGATWAYAAEGSPWPNTCYELAIDPDVPGRLWGAWGRYHDLPTWKTLRRGVETSAGGICRTDDYGMKWRPCWSDGSPPNDKGTCTTIALDASSPVDSRTLYAGFLNSGVWKSTDGGENWTECNKGLPLPPRRNVWHLELHADGTLLCGITANFPGDKHVAGGLFRSSDGGASWEVVGAEQPFDWIYGVAMDPRTSKTVYVSCYEVPPDDAPSHGCSLMGTDVPWLDGNGHGGVFKSEDGGATWERILDRPYCYDVTFHPDDPDTIYAATSVDGIARSRDGGRSWEDLALTPFVMPHRVTVDPDDRETLWVTTFGGGVWKGRPGG